MNRNILPGFRFFPTEEELLSFYLYNKLNNLRNDMNRIIPVLDIFYFDPWQLPDLSTSCVQDKEQWFFFCPQQEREANGGRPSRTTSSGYWKATGSPTQVYSSTKRRLGIKRTMVFYIGRAPIGQKTEWKLNDCRLFEDHNTTATATDKVSIHTCNAPKLRGEFSLCRICIGSGSLRSFDRRPPADDEGASASKLKLARSESNTRYKKKLRLSDNDDELI